MSLGQYQNFWPVNTNKENLQLYTRTVAVQRVDNLILSSMVSGYEIVYSLHKDGKQIRKIKEFNSWDQEADDRVSYTLIGLSRMEQNKSLIYQTIDLPWYCCYGTSIDWFMQGGLEVFLLQYSASESCRMLP